MERIRQYEFESANMGDVEFNVSGEYHNGECDIDVCISKTNAYREWDELDSEGVTEIFEWLISEGVEFASTRALWLNVHYVASVMVDADSTESEVLDAAAAMTAEGLREWRAFHFPEAVIAGE